MFVILMVITALNGDILEIAPIEQQYYTEDMCLLDASKLIEQHKKEKNVNHLITCIKVD